MLEERSIANTDDGTSSRSSRRLAGQEAEAPPPASIAGKKTQLFGLLATDSKHGRPSADCPVGRSWKLDGSAPSTLSTLSPSLCSQRYEEADDILMRRRVLFDEDESAGELENEDEDDEITIVDDDDISVEEADDDPLKMHYKAVDESGFKLLPFTELKSMIEERCACKFCQSPVVVTQKTFGIATDLYLTCQPVDRRKKKTHTYSLTGKKIKTKKAELTKTGQKAVHRDLAQQYLLNSLLILAMQQLGLGLSSVTTLLGMIGIRPTIGNQSAWKEIQDNVGLAEEEVKNEVLEENVKIAIDTATADGAKADESGRIGLVCSIDGSWQKRSSGGRMTHLPDITSLLIAEQRRFLM